jgi:hypothetical protein
MPISFHLPVVVAALQAPTLLNLWARSTRWHLRVFGGPDDLAEAALLDVPAYTIGDPVAVLVCHAPQLAQAAKLWPKAKLVWVAHNCQNVSDDPRIHGHVALNTVISRRAQEHAEALGHPASSWFVITPAYMPIRRHRWKRDVLWTMQSRPDSPSHPDPNRAADQRILDQCLARCAPTEVAYALGDPTLGTRERAFCSPRSELASRHTLYGQDQPAGFLDRAGQDRLIAACSGYLSCLRPSAGFGLAQHEMLAAGVPLIANTWAGVADDGGSLGGVRDSLDEVAQLADLICTDSLAASRIGEAGLDFISAKRNQEQMDRGIEAFLNWAAT